MAYEQDQAWVEVPGGEALTLQAGDFSKDGKAAIRFGFFNGIHKVDTTLDGVSGKKILIDGLTVEKQLLTGQEITTGLQVLRGEADSDGRSPAPWRARVQAGERKRKLSLCMVIDEQSNNWLRYREPANETLARSLFDLVYIIDAPLLRQRLRAGEQTAFHTIRRRHGPLLAKSQVTIWGLQNDSMSAQVEKIFAELTG